MRLYGSHESLLFIILCLLVQCMLITSGCARINNKAKLQAKEGTVPKSNIYQQDFDVFVETLRDSHPNIKANLPDYDKVAEELRAELATETDTLKFDAKIRQFSHKLGDGHTGVSSHRGTA